MISVLGGETCALEGCCFDAAFSLQDKLMRILGKRIPIVMLTDLASLFNMIVWSSRAMEKRLVMYLAAMREAYDTS